MTTTITCDRCGNTIKEINKLHVNVMYNSEYIFGIQRDFCPKCRDIIYQELKDVMNPKETVVKLTSNSNFTLDRIKLRLHANGQELLMHDDNCGHIIGSYSKQIYHSFSNLCELQDIIKEYYNK